MPTFKDHKAPTQKKTHSFHVASVLLNCRILDASQIQMNHDRQLYEQAHCRQSTFDAFEELVGMKVEGIMIGSHMLGSSFEVFSYIFIVFFSVSPYIYFICVFTLMYW